MATTPVREEMPKPAPAPAPVAPAPPAAAAPAIPVGAPAFLQPPRGAQSDAALKRERKEAEKRMEKEEEPR